MNKIKKIKVSVDVALFYYIISTMVTILSVIFSNLLFKDSRQLFGALSSNALTYAVLVVTILCLAVISNVLKRKVHGDSSIDCKSLNYIIVGVLLIVGGVQSVASYVSVIRLFLDLGQLVNDIYWAIVPIVLYTLQIGIGACFILKTIKRDKQIEETH
ncbi:hypothetical protein G9F72_019465 [Clostridium estertheticum]|uniref:hypothetical protein n=1 Tax=Clostridium estertheticum TaxID=238834 RepID=UPI0013E9144C|nr:hypothetical protein [Clostridium estertheticum]MBZ9688511.1 hypothetical protein [Clostridium estertheticum]